MIYQYQIFSASFVQCFLVFENEPKLASVGISSSYSNKSPDASNTIDCKDVPVGCDS